MASSKTKRCKLDKTPVKLDFAGVIKILEKRGVKKNQKTIANEVGFSVVSVGQWNKEAPEIVTMIYHFLKDNHIDFEEFVKEIHTEKND
jgi:predicted regulator of amino acid metabolism with ACT domain